MKEQIISYLQGPRNFAEGVALYEIFGVNRMLKAKFRQIGECEMTKGALFEELRKLAGLSEMDFSSMRRTAYNKPEPIPETVKSVLPKTYVDDSLIALADRFGVTVDELVSDEFIEKVLSADENQDKVDELEEELEEAKSKYCEVPETVRKTIRFREEFPFLNEKDCPNEFKILVSDMFSAYDLYRESHEMLANTPDDVASEETFRWAKTAVENYLDNREMWEELEYYRENHKILGKAKIMQELAERNEISALPDLDLVKQLNNAKSNISKGKNDLEKSDNEEKKAKAQAKIEKWTNKKDILEKEIEARKKN